MWIVTESEVGSCYSVCSLHLLQHAADNFAIKGSLSSDMQ